MLLQVGGGTGSRKAWPPVDRVLVVGLSAAQDRAVGA